MYQVPVSADDRPGCRDALLITRAVFGVVLPPVIAMLAVLILIVLVVFAFAVTPALALLPVAGIVGGILLYVRWKRNRMGGNNPGEF